MDFGPTIAARLGVELAGVDGEPIAELLEGRRLSPARARPGILAWSRLRRRTATTSTAHCSSTRAGNLCVDPVEPSDEEAEQLVAEGVERILLTNRNHTRAANRVRELTGASVEIHASDADYARKQGVGIDATLERERARRSLHAGRCARQVAGRDRAARSGATAPDRGRRVDRQSRRPLVAAPETASIDDPARLARQRSAPVDLEFDALIVGDGARSPPARARRCRRWCAPCRPSEVESGSTRSGRNGCNEAFQRLAELQACDEELWAREQEYGGCPRGARTRRPNAPRWRPRRRGRARRSRRPKPRSAGSRASSRTRRRCASARGPAVPGQDERRLHRAAARDRARAARHLGVRDAAARGHGRDRVGARRRAPSAESGGRESARASRGRGPGARRAREGARRGSGAPARGARLRVVAESEPKLIEQYERIATRRRPAVGQGSRKPVPWLPGRHPAAALHRDPARRARGHLRQLPAHPARGERA